MLKKIVITGLFVSLLGVCNVVAQQSLKYVDALQFRMINKGFNDTETPFTRLPKWLKDSVRPDLWNRGQCSSGLGIRFATDSKRVGIRYTLLWDTHMFHMADTGLKGTDLYILTEDGRWEYVNTNRPIADDKKECEKVFVENFLFFGDRSQIEAGIVRRQDVKKKPEPRRFLLDQRLTRRKIGGFCVHTVIIPYLSDLFNPCGENRENFFPHPQKSWG